MRCPRCGGKLAGGELCACGFDFRQSIGLPGPQRFQLFGTTFEGTRVVESPASRDAKQQLRRSLALAAAAPAVLLAVLLLDRVAPSRWAVPLALAPYVAWSCYWGTIGVVRVFSERKVGRFAIELAAHRMSVYGLLLPVLAGVLYGVLGGGLYEFQRARRVVKNPGLSP